MAEWKPIACFEEYYLVSNEGEIKSLRSGQLRKPQLNKSNGYYELVLCGDKKKRTLYVHRIVATAFCDNPNSYGFINHKDEDKQNNNAANLEWCTKAYNNSYNGKAQRCAKAIIQIRDGVTIKVWESAREAAKHFKTNYKNISAVCRGLRPRAGGYEWQFI